MSTPPKKLKRASGLANDPETNTAKKRKVKGGKENANQGMESGQNLAAKSPSLASTMGKNPLQPIAPKPSSGTAGLVVTNSFFAVCFLPKHHRFA